MPSKAVIILDISLRCILLSGFCTGINWNLGKLTRIGDLWGIEGILLYRKADGIGF